MYVHWRKSTNSYSREAKTETTNGREEKLGQNSDAVSGTTFRIVSVFKESSRNIIFISLFEKASCKYRNFFRMYRKY
jgi:hypothetical protein